jgi:hypothetical protein
MVAPHVVSLHQFGALRSLLLGAGLSYAVQQERYMHIPIVVVFPTAYAGYHMYKNKEDILKRFSYC